MQVIREAVGELSKEVTRDLRGKVAAIETAVIELQRRGDTLGRHEDLRLIAAGSSQRPTTAGTRATGRY